MRSSVLAFLLLLAGGLSACTSSKVVADGGKPILLNQTDQAELIRNVEVSQFRAFNYKGTIDVSELVGDRLVTSEANAMTNTTIELQGGVDTFFVNVFTLGIANARTIVVRGNLVRSNALMGTVEPPILDSVRVEPVPPSVFSVR